jgi:putative ABC transport system permease protein
VGGVVAVSSATPLLLGAAASAIGIALGFAVAIGLNALMALLGFSLPSTSMQIQPRPSG